MKVSVIISYKNEMPFISDCMNSLEDQTEKDFEAIVVCAHTAHADADVIRNMDVSFPLQVIELPEDKDGPAAAKNEGIRASRGEYVFFLDSDDYILSETFCELIRLSDGKDIVAGDIKRTWKNRLHLLNDKKDNSALCPTETADIASALSDILTSHMVLTGIKATGLLIRREFILKHSIMFDESYIYYTEIPFVAQLLVNAQSCVHISYPFYFKRLHQDPVYHPSLNQTMKTHVRLTEALRAYIDTKKITEKTTPSCEAEYDALFIRFYVQRITRFFIKDNAENKSEVFKKAKECFSLISEDALKNAKHYHHMIIKYSLRHTLDKTIKRIRMHTLRQQGLRYFHDWKRIKQFIYRHVFLNRSMNDDTFLFESFFGKSYSDSPKYIFEYIYKNNPGKFKYIWVRDKKKKLDIPYPVKHVKRGSLKYMRAMACSKYYITNIRQPMFFVKRPGAVLLETWHGTPLKRLGFDIDEAVFGTPRYKINFKLQSGQWDYLISPNEFCSETFPHCFAYDGKLLNTGYPRNDILYLPPNERTKLTCNIKNELSIPADKKVILYAPTWRDDRKLSEKEYEFSLELDLIRMRERLGDEYVILLRLHYLLVDSLDFSTLEGFAYNVSSYDDIARLYLISDVLITDYSSVFFDYANLKRPVLFFTYDLNEYADELRGFYFDMKDLVPGPLLFTTDEVIDSIINLHDVEKEYRKKYDDFYNRFCSWECGKSSQRVTEEIIK